LLYLTLSYLYCGTESLHNIKLNSRVYGMGKEGLQDGQVFHIGSNGAEFHAKLRAVLIYARWESC